MRTLFPLAVVGLTLLALPGAAVFAGDLLGYGPALNAWLESRLAVSHRLALSLPAAAALFAVPPLLILLYLLRLKRKPVPVPSTFLWKKSVEDLSANRLLRWLRANVLLLLQLLAALAIIYGVLGPRLHGALGGGRHYILLLDNSLSMAATDVAPDRLAWAKAEALKEIDAATDSDFGMVVAFSDEAEIRQSYTGNRAALRKAVQGVGPTNRVTRLDEALGLAASLANPDRSTENEVAAPRDPEPGKERQYVAAEGMAADVHLYSDGKFPPVADFALANLNLIYHVPPAASDAGESNNVAVVRLDAERDADDSSTVTVRAAVRNYRPTPADVRVRLDLRGAGGGLVGSYDEAAKSRSPVPARGVRADVRFTLSDIPAAADLILHLRVEGAADALPADDEAWLVLGVVRKAKVLVIGPPNPRLRDAFDAPALKKVADFAYHGPEAAADADPRGPLARAREGRFDLVVFDRCGPPNVDALPAANAFFVGHPPPGVAATSVAGPSVRGWDARHPVMQGLRALDEVDVAEAFALAELPPRTRRLMEGDRNLVLLAAVPRGAYTDLVLTFPLMSSDGQWNTNWPLKLSFPLFLRNVLMTLGNVRDAGAENPVRPGQVKPIRAGGAAEIRVTKPDGSAVTVERGPRAEFAVTGTDQLGVYAVRWADPGGEEGGRRFAVNLFDPLESDLAPVKDVTVGAQTVTAGEVRRPPVELWKVPVLVGLLVLVAEWWVWNRRVRL
jgi:hypothetical protein